jgi:hypothetical protein
LQSMHISIPELEPKEGRDFWLDVKEDGRPIFTAKEVAVVFFARSKLWLYRQLYASNHELDGILIEIPRSDSGQYQLQLAHVERLAHAFFSRGIINLKQFENTLTIIKAIARNYRLI